MDTRWPSHLVRKTFIDYFVDKHDHTFVFSSPVVPNNDPTLQFTNSGMNQFKPIFLGQVEPNSEQANLLRAVNSQKCIRAGGKHNDLDDVGKDTYHHTFFEMLGNWSFGDYFQVEAISMAFKLLTEVYELSPNNLYATYFEGDSVENLQPDLEAKRIWARYLPEDHIIPGNKKDNFWEMGATGPCGPCSELHYDRIGNRNAASLVNTDDPDVIEIWNLVFIQYNRESDMKLKKLPHCHVDTGMGFERLVSILQNKRSNYDTDIFTPIFSEIQRITGAPSYQGRIGKDDVNTVDTAYRIIADHIRTLVFAISDGSSPGPVERGYILRRVLRRAVRYGRDILNAQPGFFSLLVPCVVAQMSNFYTNLLDNKERIIEAISVEEHKFDKSISLGLNKFKNMISNMQPGSEISAQNVFILYNAYGFPDDLTRLMAEEKGIRIDSDGFKALMEAKKDECRKVHLAKTVTNHLELSVNAVDKLESQGKAFTDDSFKYSLRDIEGTLLAIWNGTEFVNEWNSQVPVCLVFDRTNFYSVSGGQVCDRGFIINENATFNVDDVKKFGRYVAHVGTLENGLIKVGDVFSLEINVDRRKNIANNHTSTHMVNQAIRSVLGDEIDQKGSVVGPKKLRFDFGYNKHVESQDLKKIDDMVCSCIREGLRVYSRDIELEVARSITGIRAVFGEKYPDPVRVVTIGVPIEKLLAEPKNVEWYNYSIELCGGTHLTNVNEAELFTIVDEFQNASGVHRLVAVTGEEARMAQKKLSELEEELNSLNNLSDNSKLNLLINEFIYKFENSLIPAYRRITMRKEIEVIKGDAQKHVIQVIKSAQKNADNYIQEIVQKIKDNNVSYWTDIIQVGGNTEQLGKTAKSIVEFAKTQGIAVPVLLMSKDESNPKKMRTIIASVVPDEYTSKDLKANEWAKQAAVILGGKGGGKDQVAQGQGPEVSKTEEALKFATNYVLTKLKL